MSETSSEAYTVNVFVKHGDPEGIRVFEQVNWTGQAISFPRDQWPVAKRMPEFTLPGVYILSGYQSEADEEPTLYIGEGDGIGNRIESHFQNKDFWSHGIAFVSKHDRLNKAHIQWLEYALVQQASATRRSRLDNGNVPQEPALADSEKAGTRTFFKEILKILPLAGLHAFEVPKSYTLQTVRPTAGKITAPADAISVDGGRAAVTASVASALPDTIVVPAQPEGFREVFLQEQKWRALRIAPGRLGQIKWIAAYQVSPIAAITHIAPIERIELYGESGKYQIVFAEPAKVINPIPFGSAPLGYMQGIKYTTLARLMAAKTVADLVER